MNLLRILIKSGIDSDVLRDFNLEFPIFGFRNIESAEEIESQITGQKYRDADTHTPEGFEVHESTVVFILGPRLTGENEYQKQPENKQEFGGESQDRNENHRLNRWIDDHVNRM